MWFRPVLAWFSLVQVSACEFCLVQARSSLVQACSSVRSGLLRLGSVTFGFGQAGLRLSSARSDLFQFTVGLLTWPGPEFSFG